MRIDAATEATPELLEALTSLLPQLNPQLRPLTMERLARVVADPATTLLVVSDGDNRIVGTAAVLVYATPAYVKARVEDVVVDESARGKGVGDALVRRCIEVARERGAEIVELQSARWREVANRLYPRLGFQLRESNLYRLDL
ncbi:MAG TPA: GNAT family N-acetyltransferase [Candidatus Dormibacteraeota bacterium]|nr:GNAT family N-acetyltransferase [Candidatus Dormibacteraeota bacterium]